MLSHRSSAKLTTLVCCCLFSVSLGAQHFNGGFRVAGTAAPTILSRDYQALGINPANLGIETKKTVYFGLLETGFNVYSDAFDKSRLKEVINNFGSDAAFTPEQRSRDAQNFANKGFGADISINLIGVSVKAGNLGGFAFGVNEVMSAYIQLNPTASDIMFNGWRAQYFDSLYVEQGETIGFSNNPRFISDITDGSRIYQSWTRQWNLAWGRQMYESENMKIYAGAGLRYIQGFSTINVKSEGGTLTAYTAFSPVFDFDDINVQGGNFERGGRLKPVGRGFGVDLSGTIEINEKIYATAALTNVGSIKWTGNLIRLNDDELVASNYDGMEYNPGDMSFTGGSGLHWVAEHSVKQQLPSALRLGGAYKLYENMTAAGDIFLPLNDVPGAQQRPILGAGIQLKTLEVLYLSGGLSTGGNFGFSIPLGLTVSFNEIYEFGIASRDALTFITQRNPNMSFVGGFLRFGI